MGTGRCWQSQRWWRAVLTVVHYFFSLSNINDHYRSHWKSQVLLTINVSFLFYSQESTSQGQHDKETDIASGKRSLTAEASTEFLGGLEAQSKNIRDAFVKQQEWAAICLYYALTMALHDWHLIIIHRDHGIKIDLRNFSPSVLLSPINPSIQLTILSSRNWFHMYIIQHQQLKFLAVMLSNDKLWRWEKMGLRQPRKCLQYISIQVWNICDHLSWVLTLGIGL